MKKKWEKDVDAITLATLHFLFMFVCLFIYGFSSIWLFQSITSTTFFILHGMAWSIWQVQTIRNNHYSMLIIEKVVLGNKASRLEGIKWVGPFKCLLVKLYCRVKTKGRNEMERNNQERFKYANTDERETKQNAVTRLSLLHALARWTKTKSLTYQMMILVN